MNNENNIINNDNLTTESPAVSYIPATTATNAAEVSPADKPSTEIAEAPVKTNAKKPVDDVSKVKIRTIINQRLKKCGYKRIISYLIVGIICFGCGFGVDRLVVGHRAYRNINGKHNSMNFYKGGFNGRSFNKGNNQYYFPGKSMPNNGTQNNTAPSNPAQSTPAPSNSGSGK